MHEFDTEIGDYVDGTLPRERAAALEAHLSSCDRCRALATDFATLRAAAGSLDRRTPSSQVWPRVAAGVTVPQRRFTWGTWGPPAAWRSAWAAGILLTLLTAGTWVAWRDTADQARPAPVAVDGARELTAGPDHVEMLRDEISQLEPIVDPAFLPDQTKAAFQGGLAQIDDVIVRADAVSREEADYDLAQQSLFEALRSKLTLLQEMLALINEMRKGNQEGTARIVSEMEP